jgi:hypothetical protein
MTRKKGVLEEYTLQFWVCEGLLKIKMLDWGDAKQ